VSAEEQYFSSAEGVYWSFPVARDIIEEVNSSIFL